MEKKKKTKSKANKSSREVTVVNNSIAPETYAKPQQFKGWGGVMSTVSKPDDLAVREFCQKVAQVYGVPPMGVNSLSGQPYLNKDGRLFLLHDIAKNEKNKVVKIKTDFIQVSNNINEVAICRKTIVYKDGTEIEGIGEASKDNVKLDAVKKTLNMMAETRALNRAIWQAIAGSVYRRVENNLVKSTMSEDEKRKVTEAGRVSFEEVDGPHNEAHNAEYTDVTITPVDQQPPAPPKKKASTPEELEAQLKTYVARCNNIDELMSTDMKLQASDIYRPEFKEAMHKMISEKVDQLTNG